MHSCWERFLILVYCPTLADSNRMFALGVFDVFQMDDHESVADQAYNILQILGSVAMFRKTPIDEQEVIKVIIEKLPESWEDYAQRLRHEQKELSFEALITRLREEEVARDQKVGGTINWINSNSNFSANENVCQQMHAHSTQTAQFTILFRNSSKKLPWKPFFNKNKWGIVGVFFYKKLKVLVYILYKERFLIFFLEKSN